jgi:Zn-dependent metalloprotease
MIHRKLVDKAIDTYYTNKVFMPLFEYSSDNNFIILETEYKNTFIKVIDIQEHNLNPDYAYPLYYLLSLKACITHPNEKRYEHDIIFNVYNFLHFLDINNIIFKYKDLVIISNIPGLDNAFWNGSYLSFGGGHSGNPLTSSMIVAHELTHALTQQICDLEYKGQSGALNESYSDVFGVCYEFFIHEHLNSLGWELGSETGILLRNMQYPHICNQPETIFDNYYVRDNYSDNGGVHINSGIPNHIFFEVQDVIGWRKAFELWVRVLYRLHRRSNFNDFKKTMLYVNHSDIVIDYITLKNILDRHLG